jgi:6-phosphogluconolactonase
MVRGAKRQTWWAGSILLLAALTSCKSVGGPAAHSQEGPVAPMSTPVQVAVYAGVGNSLRVFGMDTKTGELTPRQAVADLAGVVQYVAVHPAGTSLYVACSETPPPKDRPPATAVYAFAIDRSTGAIAQIGEPFTRLPRAIHATVDNSGRYLLLAHNVTESATVLRLNPDGSLGEPVKQPEEPEHLGFLAHQIRVDPSNKWAIVSVRGDEEKVQVDGKQKKTEPEKTGHLVLFAFDDGVLTKRHAVDFPSHLGPRHIDFHPTKPLFYVSMERGNRILTYKHEDGVVTELYDTTTLGDPTLAFPDQRAGPIQVHPSGRWVYVANRNTHVCSPKTPCEGRSGPGENDVAVFSLDSTTGEPKLVAHVDTHGFEPRTMTIDPTLHFLVVANQKEVSPPDAPDKTAKVSPNLSVFRIGDDGGLSYVRTYDVTGGEAWWVGAVALRRHP